MRGKLSKGIQEKSLKVLNREITEREMRLYAYVDFCLKNGGIIEFRKINAGEEDILFALQKEKHIKLEESGINFKCVCTREYYDYIQDILADSYVEEWF